MKKKIKNKKQLPEIALLGESSPFAAKETYNQVCTNLMFSMNQQGVPSKVFAVTSSVPGEGKSTTAANLAISFATMGKKVLLIDADLRRPSQQKIWGFRAGKGLSNLLSGVGECCLREVASLPLTIISSGDIPPNPSELFSSAMFRKSMAHFRDNYDYVVVDTPPINIVSDAQIIAREIDGIALVVRSGVTDQRDLMHACDQIERSGAKCCGIIVNGFNPKSSGHYGYSYDYEYGESKHEHKRNQK